MKILDTSIWLKNGDWKIGFIPYAAQCVGGRDYKTFCIGRLCISWWMYENTCKS